jgi:hypothetical protein
MTSAPGAAAPRTVGIGDNSQAFAFDEAAIEEQLKRDHKDVVGRAADLDTAATFRLPEVIEDEETAGRMAEFGVQCRKALTALKSTATEAVVPYSRPVAIVKGFFTRLTEQVEAAKAKSDKLLIGWDTVKRARLQAQAWRPRAGECVDRLTRGAAVADLEKTHLTHLRMLDADGNVTPLGAAERTAHVEAQEQQRRAAVATAREQRRANEEDGVAYEAPPPPAPMPPPAPLMAMPIPASATTVRSERGATAGVRTVWKPVIVNPELVPRQYCDPSQVKLNAAAKLLPKDADNKPTETIPGVEWQASTSVTARG